MKALIVEDNESLREMYALFLKSIGFTADEAPDGMAAFKKMEQSVYDVIISDMDMPVANGMEFYRMVEKALPDMVERIIFSTGNDFDEGYKKFYRSTPCPLLIKPFSLSELKEMINLVCRRKFRKAAAGGRLLKKNRCA